LSRKYKFNDNDKLYFVTFAIVYWIDLFIREEYKNIVLDSWKYCIQHKGMQLYGWCIMTSHVHMIIGSHADKLERIMQNMKRHTSDNLAIVHSSHRASINSAVKRKHAALV
jgi:REP element-mobilizing transposase RayT